MFEKVSRSLKYDSKLFFCPQTYIYIYIYEDTKTNHFTPLALRVRGKDTPPQIQVLISDVLLAKFVLCIHNSICISAKLNLLWGSDILVIILCHENFKFLLFKFHIF